MHDRIPLDDLDRELTEETLTELCARRLTIEEIAEFVDEREHHVERALGQYGLEATGYRPPSGTVAATLLATDPDVTESETEPQSTTLEKFAGGQA
ncbi:hypothetical protein [Natronosalvus halobius]|uniref:hypothetical protein n=1 Tax=Natronosalvus halobius TaxID=2953746 RepID=UPI00209DD0FE|nr:hypothetical protein [Natronosalvus halobius]USZ73749.1 hypothetical protein NGM15_18605 [Natronosalvus halobius]